MRILKFVLSVELFLLCGLINANPKHPEQEIEVVNPPNLTIMFNTSGIDESKWDDDVWYQVRWRAKVFNEGKPPKNAPRAPDYELMGELDAYTAYVTALSFIKWPEDHNARSYYEFTCEFMDYVGDDPDDITEEPPPPSFAEVTVKLECFWKDDTPFVILSSSGDSDPDKVGVFDVTVSQGAAIKSVSVDIGQKEKLKVHKFNLF